VVIEAWQKARQLAREIYQATSQRPFARDLALRDQIRRSTVSVVSNIAEGFERDSTAEFRQLLSVAKGSAGEVRAQLYIAYDIGLLPKEQFEQLLEQTNEVSRMLKGFINYLNATNFRGNKYKPTQSREP
jgi:four helix bundle protein